MAALRDRRKFAIGLALGALLLTGLAEAFLRLFPPRDLHPYIADASPLSGPFAPDTGFGLRYSSWPEFHAEYAERLGDMKPSPADPRPMWAFFGNSFVQAPGMLADTARVAMPTRRVVNLGRNELLIVRLAQIRLLLENGFAPERLFIELMPIDLLSLGEDPLDSIYVTKQGALTYRPRLPAGPGRKLVEHSRLALTAWIRAGRHHGNPNFNSRKLYDRIDDILFADVRRSFAGVARIAHERRVPVTIVLIPTCHQVMRSAGYVFQDTVTALFREFGFDVHDPRLAFHAHAQPAALYLPDKHLTHVGNCLLFVDLHAHVAALGKPSPDARTALAGAP